MKTAINGLAFALMTLLAWTQVQAADLSLPKQMPELGTTEQAKLGSRDNDIGLAPGSSVPEFEIKDHQGNTVSFEDLQTKAPLMVVFYRGGWCPYCNLQIRQLTEAWPEFKQRGVTPVLISVDKPDAAALAQRSYDIPFPVLSDPNLLAHDAFQVTMKIDDALIPKYKQYGIDVEQWSGKTHHKIAVSSAFFVDKKGKILWAHSAMDYKTRPSVEQLLQVIDAL